MISNDYTTAVYSRLVPNLGSTCNLALSQIWPNFGFRFLLNFQNVIEIYDAKIYCTLVTLHYVFQTVRLVHNSK